MCQDVVPPPCSTDSLNPGKVARELRQKSSDLFLAPLKGGIGRSHVSPPRFGKDYKWYISGIFPANWGMDYATLCHLLTEPETTIENHSNCLFLRRIPDFSAEQNLPRLAG